MTTQEKLSIIDREIALADQLKAKVEDELASWRAQYALYASVETSIKTLLAAAVSSQQTLASIREQVVLGKL